MSSLEKIIKNCACIDIGSEKVFVAIEGKKVRSFRAFTRTYKELGFYMQENVITHVAMEVCSLEQDEGLIVLMADRGMIFF